jgi:hypothetical protein
MKISKYSNRTKIIVIIWLLFSIPLVLSSFTDIIEKNPIYEWVCILSVLVWMISLYFDGSKKTN